MLTLFGQVHLPAMFTIPPLALAAAGLVWYWLLLGRPNVPPSRRRIRRISIAIMLLGMPLLVRGVSFLDPAIQSQHRAYVTTWLLVLVFVLAVVVTAVFDIVNNLRLHHASTVDEMHDAALKLRDALHSQRASGAVASSSNGRAASHNGSSGGPVSKHGNKGGASRS
jgi:hypothetical protein